MNFLAVLGFLSTAAALPATSLLQVTVQLQRGSVGELAATTIEALEAGGHNLTVAGLAQVGKTEAACPNCPEASKAELDALAAVEEEEEDEMVALASQAKVSLLQRGLELQHGPAKAKEIAHLHASGIDDAEEALALLDAASELGL
ncbi:unnamed protein product [Effrenium voratum]|nr:unnamed protein product [Effrenium voratum]|mmetsp:Transcript_47109/g.111886  ORF Transcript_47109/g.111886 Transcript_47109/m.111886 type:complete len:146 (+) Transcript_47109:73-510(+)|eukprot:CAMPEP_0181472502 /NCGR_PEP_ID=MMETSP1110-20121109/39636_1 /TAXON_ID=174948 /ORGANISM="Symbiodinium sp., Strain CCMP421" /LENGTH=145 /DNA_ID=CAMNT_0023597579 /DNA_START=67 /DNA_END=504 /DNA_ORIENTATION=+